MKLQLLLNTKLWIFKCTYDRKSSNVIHRLQHGEGGLPEDFQSSPEGAHAVIQPSSSQLQLGAVQQDDRRFLFKLDKKGTISGAEKI